MNSTHQARKREITRLTNVWYDYVSMSHHKDCDCHFYINKTWSYGEKPFYSVQHYGYVTNKDFIIKSKDKSNTKISLLAISY